MVDRKAFEVELQEIRKAREEAQAAVGGLEDLIDAMRRPNGHWRGLELYELQQSPSRH